MSESPTEHFEHAEHAGHVAHAHDPFLTKVSITIAVLAVLSAAVGSLETIETADTIRDKTSAAIRQNQATDQWGAFSKQSIKKSMYDLAGDAATGAKAEAYKTKAKQYEAESREAQAKAQEIEKAVHEANEASEHHEHRHQVFTISATLLHIAIAVATIAIVMRGRRWPYLAALVLGLLGTVGTAFAFF